MLQNIFLFKGNKIQDLEELNTYHYPHEIINIRNKSLVNKIIKVHIQGNNIDHSELSSESDSQPCSNSSHHKIDKPVAQYINDLNIYTSCVDDTIIVGLIFEDEDNPYDYKEIFEELLCDSLNNESKFYFDDEFEVDNLLISIFIDIRRFGDEVVEKPPEI